MVRLVYVNTYNGAYLHRISSFYMTFHSGLVDGQTGRTDGRTDGRTASIHNAAP